MPLQIRELIVKTTINEVKGKSSTGQDSNYSNVLKEDIVQACVEQVIQILKRRKER